MTTKSKRNRSEEEQHNFVATPWFSVTSWFPLLVTTETCQNQIATSGRRKEMATIPGNKKNIKYIIQNMELRSLWHSSECCSTTMAALCASTFHIENRYPPFRKSSEWARHWHKKLTSKKCCNIFSTLFLAPLFCVARFFFFLFSFYTRWNNRK